MSEEGAKGVVEETKPNKDNGKPVTKKEVTEVAEMKGQFDIQLEEVDQLRAENAQLKLMNESARQAALMRELQENEKNLDRLQTAYMKLIVELGEKYGFNPDLTEMEPGTGRVVPRGTVRR